MLTKILAAESLFFDHHAAQKGLWNDLYTAVEQGDSVAGLTRGLLEASDSIETSLALWELRLNSLVLGGNLAVAKQEAVALNNALYMAENDGSDSPAETLALDSSRVLPLPRNNQREISHRLLVLLLRLKSVPNMALVNEWYKLCYQLRLKSTAMSPQLSAQLACLSYDIMVILVINKNYTTLHSFLGSLEYEDEMYRKRVQLVDLIVRIICYSQNGVAREEIVKQVDLASDCHTTVDNLPPLLAKQDLIYVLNHFSPLYSLGTTPEQEKAAALPIDDFDVAKLVDLVLEGHITGRIICCMMGVWDVQTNLGYDLDSFEDPSTSSPPETPTLKDCSDLMNQSWKLLVNKVYGLE